MRNKVARKLRSIIPVDTEIGRRNYRRAKKKYSQLSAEARPLFINGLRAFVEGTSN